MVRDYETVCIVNPESGETAAKAVIAKATEVISDGKGTLHGVNEWGRKKLAYPIQKKNEGIYFVITSSLEAATLSEMERQLRLNEDVMRYQTVKLEGFNPEAEAKRVAAVKAAEAEAEAKAAEAAPAEETAKAEEAPAAEAAPAEETAAPETTSEGGDE